MEPEVTGNVGGRSGGRARGPLILLPYFMVSALYLLTALRSSCPKNRTQDVSQRAGFRFSLIIPVWF
jgi:hypothetical protein